LLTDTNRNGSIDPAAETSLYDFGSRSNTEIVGDGITYPITIRFDGRGHSSSGPCSAPTPAYASTTFCELPCTAATANSENATVICVAPTGATTALLGGETIPNFDAPTVTTVTESTYLNPLLSVWNAITGTPTPTPPAGSPTPPAETPTPPAETPTPPAETPTPPAETPTPPAETPTPTPVPTPTPLRACNYKEKPGIPAKCSCDLPWTVISSSGQCRD
jgi:hypothetical protein